MQPILVLVAPGFEEIELTTPVDIMRQLEIPVTMAGVEGMESEGVHGVVIKADVLLADVDADKFDGIVLPGGAAAWPLRDNPEVVALVRRMYDAGKMVAAICASPMSLQAAGILEGKRITCFPHHPEVPAYFPESVRQCADKVVTDGNIITGKGPGAAFELGFAIGAYLGKEKEIPALQERLCWL